MQRKKSSFLICISSFEGKGGGGGGGGERIFFASASSCEEGVQVRRGWRGCLGDQGKEKDFIFNCSV